MDYSTYNEATYRQSESLRLVQKHHVGIDMQAPGALDENDVPPYPPPAPPDRSRRDDVLR